MPRVVAGRCLTLFCGFVAFGDCLSADEDCRTRRGCCFAGGGNAAGACAPRAPEILEEDLLGREGRDEGRKLLGASPAEASTGVPPEDVPVVREVCLAEDCRDDVREGLDAGEKLGTFCPTPRADDDAPAADCDADFLRPAAGIKLGGEPIAPSVSSLILPPKSRPYTVCTVQGRYQLVAVQFSAGTAHTVTLR